MSAKIRAIILDLGGTAFSFMMVAGLLYWAARLMFNPRPVGDWFDALIVRASELIQPVWDWVPSLNATVTSLVVTGAFGSGWLVRLATRTRGISNDESNAIHTHCACEGTRTE